MKHIVFFFCFFAASFVWAADTEVTIQRAQSKLNAGFKERIYIDGREVISLANGASGKVRVAAGEHTIYAELSTLKTQKVNFTADSSAMTLTITPYSLDNFIIESGGVALAAGAVTVPAPAAKTAPAPAAKAAPAPARASNSVEASLENAADKIMEDIPPKSRLAIVFVTAADPSVAEFIAGELEFIFVENKLIVIDRSQLDQIRKEQNLQMSGEIDDRQAVNIGKMAGANYIITGAVTGTGDLRRLRLRVLDTQTAQVLAVASERY